MKNFLNIKKIENMSLISQLTFLTLTALVLSLSFFYVILKNILLPFYEENLYTYLGQPANYIRISNNGVGENVSFIIQTTNGARLVSDNFNTMFSGEDVNTILKNVKNNKGKIKINGSTFYYVVGEGKEIGSREKNTNILFTTDDLIKQQQRNLNKIILPTMIITITIVTLILVTWSKYIVKKIKILKEKTENIDNEKYDHTTEFIVDDELNMLNNCIEKTRRNLKQKEEYKNLMFQSLSHELKTPISVIKSYIEGVQDNVIDEKEAIPIILEETNRLNEQVKTILHFNKIDYMKDVNKYKGSKIDLVGLINKSVNKHKIQRKDVNWLVDIKDDVKEFNGTEEMWQKVIDNILSNFERYAKQNIKIEISNNRIRFFNDGEQIEKKLLDNIFLPYIKGKKGQSGLGLGVVKNTVNLFEYEILAKNEKDGVLFEIYLPLK